MRELAAALPDVTREAHAARDGTVRLRIAADPAGGLPPVDPAAVDVCLTTRSDPPLPWVSVADVGRARAALERTVHEHASAATVLLGLLRSSGLLPFADALAVESLGYSVLLGGRDFRDWLARRRDAVPSSTAAEPVRFERTGDVVTLSLADPRRLNAYSCAMRDALACALDSCLVDPTVPAVVLRGDGRAFCSGGARDEFGTATDLALAHCVRLEQSAARRLATLGPRASAVVHGAVVGSGLEISAASARVIARQDAWFRLPELAMGLIPGAGGTVTVPRRIGRHRAAYLMLSGARLDAVDALAWGLVDGIAP